MLSNSYVNSFSDTLDEEDHETRLQQLASKMLNENRNYCTKCKSKNCTKHLQRYRVVKLAMPPVKSSYASSFNRMVNEHAERVCVPIEQRKLSSIIGDSSYKNAFKRSKSNDREGYCKAKDNIRLGGPFNQSTTYQQAYYESTSVPKQESLIKNPESINIIPVKLNGISSYRQCFKTSQPQQRAVPLKRQGQLRINGSFNGQSTYKDGYKASADLVETQSFKPKRFYQPVSGLRIASSYASSFPNYPVQSYLTIQQNDQ